MADVRSALPRRGQTRPVVRRPAVVAARGTNNRHPDRKETMTTQTHVAAPTSRRPTSRVALEVLKNRFREYLQFDSFVFRQLASYASLAGATALRACGKRDKALRL